ncbi:hypothetical protein DHW03_14100 [Pedobacter yonginense]|uniref:Uncharacterized protein n=1 Tax=Pedobacter yonginense TaxID=651869 RepID=A0A317EJW6_9SPHI|nr:DUF6515 family protein [Pedobacter yonginense]PWS27131.1 hypothetical protein DHW03_14100 [Pedobacter yonginense]
MNRLFNRSLVVFAVAALVATLNVDNAFAQRPSRGGGSVGGRSGGNIGGGRPSAVSPSRGGGSISRQPSMQAPSRGGIQGPSSGSYRPGPGISRPGGRPIRPNYGYNRSGYRPGGYYRPGFGYRPRYGYYGYHNYYRPFIGFRLNVLPYGYYPFYFGPTQYYYSGGLFYRQYENNYQVVVPPVGAEVPNLPSDASLVTIDGVDYYEYKGVYYTQSTNADGKTIYVVAGKDGVLNTTDGPVDTHQIGDVIPQLPEGCREVTIKNDKYFVSPDDVYYEEVIEGNTISYRVIGKLF